MENQGNNKNSKTSLLLIVLIILLIYQNSRINKRLEQLEFSVNNRMSMLEVRLNSLSYEMSNSIKNMLTEASESVTVGEIRYEGFKEDGKVVTLSIPFETKSKNPGSEYFVGYAVEGRSVYNTAKAENIGGNQFLCRLDLAADSNYNFSILEKFENGHESRLNTREISKPIAYELANRTLINLGRRYSSSEGLVFNINLENNTHFLEAFKIKTVVVDLLYSNEVFYSEDITNKNRINQMEIEKTNLMIAAGEINPPSAMPGLAYGPIIEKGNIEFCFYEVEVPDKVLKEKGIQLSHSGSYGSRSYSLGSYGTTSTLDDIVKCRITVTYQNGDQYVR